MTSRKSQYYANQLGLHFSDVQSILEEGALRTVLVIANLLLPSLPFHELWLVCESMLSPLMQILSLNAAALASESAQQQVYYLALGRVLGSPA